MLKQIKSDYNNFYNCCGAQLISMQIELSCKLFRTAVLQLQVQLCNCVNSAATLN